MYHTNFHNKMIVFDIFNQLKHIPSVAQWDHPFTGRNDDGHWGRASGMKVYSYYWGFPIISEEPRGWVVGFVIPVTEVTCRLPLYVGDLKKPCIMYS